MILIHTSNLSQQMNLFQEIRIHFTKYTLSKRHLHSSSYSDSFNSNSNQSSSSSSSSLLQTTRANPLLTNSVDMCGHDTSIHSLPDDSLPTAKRSHTQVEHSSNEVELPVTLQKGIRTTKSTHHNITSQIITVCYHHIMPLLPT